MDLYYLHSDWTFDISLFFSQTWAWPLDGTLFGRYLAGMLASRRWCCNISIDYQLMYTPPRRLHARAIRTEMY